MAVCAAGLYIRLPVEVFVMEISSVDRPRSDCLLYNIIIDPLVGSYRPSDPE